MKKVIVFPILMTIFALANTSCSYAAFAQRAESPAKTVTLPSADVLQKRLGRLVSAHFLEKTKLDKQLGGSETIPTGVVISVELAMHDYIQLVGNPMIARQMEMVKPRIIAAILQDYPEAIENLKALGAL